MRQKVNSPKFLSHTRKKKSGRCRIHEVVYEGRFFSAVTKSFKMFVDADEFTSVCSDAISVLNNQKTLHVEAAALSRLLYRMKSKMRCDKGFKFMAKVGTLYHWLLSSQPRVKCVKMIQSHLCKYIQIPWYIVISTSRLYLQSFLNSGHILQCNNQIYTSFVCTMFWQNYMT
jgi:hypothetical protein